MNQVLLNPFQIEIYYHYANLRENCTNLFLLVKKLGAQQLCPKNGTRKKSTDHPSTGDPWCNSAHFVLAQCYLDPTLASIYSMSTL